MEDIYISSEEILAENKRLKDRINDLEEKLSKYTNGSNHKKYYEKNKDKIKEKSRLYLEKLKEENPDKIKEYARRAYLKKKEKDKLMKEQNERELEKND